VEYTRRIERVKLIDTENAPQIASGKVKKMARIEKRLFSALHSMAKKPRRGRSAALSQLVKTIHSAAMLAEHAPLIMPGSNGGFFDKHIYEPLGQRRK
jgi:hypothetical protein